MQRPVSPVVVVIAVLLLIVVLVAIYKVVLGKKPSQAAPGVVPAPGQYQHGMPGTGEPSAAPGSPQPQAPGG